MLRKRDIMMQDRSVIASFQNCSKRFGKYTLISNRLMDCTQVSFKAQWKQMPKVKWTVNIFFCRIGTAVLRIMWTEEIRQQCRSDVQMHYLEIEK